MALCWASLAGAVDPDPRPFLRLDLGQHTTPIQRLAAAATGEVVVTGGADGSVRVWSSNGEALTRFFLPLGEGRTGEVTALTVSRSGRTVLAAAKPFDVPAGQSASSIYFLRATSGQILHRADVAFERDGQRRRIAGTVTHLTMAPEGDHYGLVAGPWGWQVFATRGATKLAGALAFDDAANWIEFAPGGSFAVGFRSGALEFHRIHEDGSVRRLARLDGDPRHEIASLAFSPNGRELAIGYYRQTIVDILDLETLEKVRRLSGPTEPGGNLAFVAWAPSPSHPGGLLYAGGTAKVRGGEDTAVVVWPNGAGRATAFGAARDSLTHLAPLSQGDVLYASADPSWGRLALGDTSVPPMPAVAIGGAATPPAPTTAATLARIVEVGPRTYDFRRTRGRGLHVSADGLVVEVVSTAPDAIPLRFDLAGLNRTDGAAAPLPDRDSSPPAPPDEVEARIEVGGRRLEIAGNSLAGTLATDERALAVATRGADVVVSTDYHLLRFDAAGREVGRTAIRAAGWAVAIAADQPVAVAALGDGTLRWYALGEDGSIAELAAVFLHPDQTRWVAWTYDGHFAHADLGGASLVGYQLNGTAAAPTGRWIGMQTLYHRLYRPDAVATIVTDPTRWQAVLRREALDALLNESSASTVELTAFCPTPTLTLGRRLRAVTGTANDAARIADCREVTDVALGLTVAPDGQLGASVGAGTRAVELVVDLGLGGRRLSHVDLMANGANVGRFDLDDAGAATQVAITAPLVADLTMLGLRLHRNDGVYTEIPPLMLRRDPTVAVEPPPSTLRVLTVGIDAYPDEIGALERAASDAAMVARTLAAGGAQLYDVIDKPVVLLDEAASATAVLEALKAIATATAPQDGVVVYFAGHGVVTAAGEYSFLTADLATAAEAADGLTNARLTAAIGRIPTGNVLLVLDSCYAGAFRIEGPSRLAHDIGRLTLAASTSYQQALDNPPDSPHGLFAGTMVDGLTGAAALDGVVEALSLGLFLRTEVERRARARAHDQQAVLRTTAGTLDAFPLASATRLQDER